MNRQLDKIFKLQFLEFVFPLSIGLSVSTAYFFYRDFRNISLVYFYEVLILSLGIYQQIFGNIDRALRSGTTRKTFLKSSAINLFIVLLVLAVMNTIGSVLLKDVRSGIFTWVETYDLFMRPILYFMSLMTISALISVVLSIIYRYKIEGLIVLSAITGLILLSIKLADSKLPMIGNFVIGNFTTGSPIKIIILNLIVSGIIFIFLRKRFLIIDSK